MGITSRRTAKRDYIDTADNVIIGGVAIGGGGGSCRNCGKCDYCLGGSGGSGGSMMPMIDTFDYGAIATQPQQGDTMKNNCPHDRCTLRIIATDRSEDGAVMSHDEFTVVDLDSSSGTSYPNNALVNGAIPAAVTRAMQSLVNKCSGGRITDFEISVRCISIDGEAIN